MLSLTRILVPVDFSTPMAGLLPYVKSLAKCFGSEIILLHVIDNSPIVQQSLSLAELTIELPPLSSWIAEMEKCLSAYAQEELAGLPVRRLVVVGNPAEEIVAFAHSHQVGMIVMPTHGYGRVRRFLIGSVTAKVLHDAACPVLTGAHVDDSRATPRHEPIYQRRILCSLDLGPHSEQTLKWAATMARNFKARLSIVHVIPGASSGLGSDMDIDRQMKLQSKAEQRLEELKQAEDVPAATYVERGEPAHQVAALAGNLDADLLIIGRTPAEGRLRTHAYAIIRHSPCPVVSI